MNHWTGRKHSESSKLKMSEAKKGYIPWNKGKKCPKISKTLMGHSVSKETREKLRQARLKQSDPRLGRKHSKETRLKMSKWQLGKKLSEETRKKIGDGNRGKTVSKKIRKQISDTLKGRISVCEIMNHEVALDILSDSLEQGYRWVDVVDTIVEREWEDVWNGDEGDVLFGEPVTIDEYKHFRYGGAGTLDTKEFNEYLYNRLYDEYSFFM